MQNKLTNVLNRVFVLEFYRLNAGFFLLFGTLAFGFMSSIEHKALGQFFVSSVPAVMIPVGVWFLYLLKVLRFDVDQLNLSSNRFLFNIQFLSRAQQLRAAAGFLLPQFTPAIAYGLFLALMALQSASYSIIAIIGIAQVILIACGTLVMARNFRNPGRQVKITVVKRFIDRHYVRPVLLFYTEWILRNEPLMLGGTKLFAGALIYGVCQLYLPEYDLRLMAMTMTVCGIANVPLLYHLTIFEHSHMSWLKNMPVTMFTRYGRILAAGAFFCLVEIAVLIKNFTGPFGLWWTAQSVLYLVSLIALFIGYLQIATASLESVVKQTFWIFVALILMLLFKIPLIILTIANMICGYLLFRKNYYLYETFRE